MTYTILMIEDDSGFYENVSQYSKKNKLYYDIKRIKSTEDLLFFLRSNSVDLLLISYNLESEKEMVFNKVIKELKRNSTISNIPIVVCSKKESFENQEMALDQGADDFYGKSTPLSLLYSKINSIKKN